jgi:hypothetical protein
LKTFSKIDAMNLNWLNFYILPVVCLIGLAIELVSSITFYKINTHKRRVIKIYKYLFLYSISDILILTINLVFGIFKCGSYCQIERYIGLYFIKQFERIAKIFLGNTLYTFNVLIELKIAFDRYNE